MRSKFLAIFGSILFSSALLVALGMNGRVAAKPEAAVGGAALPTTFRISESVAGDEANGESTMPALSANGRFAAFASKASNLDPQDTNFFQDIFVTDLETKVITRVVDFVQTGSPNGDSFNPNISANGRFVAFETEATDFASSQELSDDNNGTDIYVYDTVNNSLNIVSADPEQFVIGNGPSYLPAVAGVGEGYRVAFVSEAANLSPDDTDSTPDIYVFTYDPSAFSYDIQVVSVNTLGIKGNGASTHPAISANGRYVAFESDATNLVVGDSNDATDIFVHDLDTGKTTRVSVDSNGTQATGPSFEPTLSFNGQVVVFTSAASNLVPGDSNGVEDIFSRNQLTGTVKRLSLDSNGVEGNGHSFEAQVADSGLALVFLSEATNLVPNDTNGVTDVFRHNIVSGNTERASLTFDGGESNGGSGPPDVTADGRLIAFDAAADNLISNDSNGFLDVFIREVDTAAKSFRYTAEEVPPNSVVTGSVEAETAVQWYKIDVDTAGSTLTTTIS